MAGSLFNISPATPLITFSNPSSHSLTYSSNLRTNCTFISPLALYFLVDLFIINANNLAHRSRCGGCLLFASLLVRLPLFLT